MAFAILRVEKLKTHQNIAGSLAHNYRTRETPNASMFGGTDSVSYKIKKKRLLKHVKLFLGRDIMRNK